MAARLADRARQRQTIDLARSVRYGDAVRAEIAGAAGALLLGGVGTGSLAVGSPAGLEGMPPATDDVLEDALARQADVFAQAIGGHRDAALPGSRESARALAAAQAMRRARLNRDVEDVTLAG